MHRYLTGLITTDYLRFPPFPYRSRHWSVDLATTKLSTKSSGSYGLEHDNRVVKGKEIILSAPTPAIAERAAFLIQAAIELTDPGHLLPWLDFEIELHDLDEQQRIQQGASGREIRQSLDRDYLPMDCMIALKVASRTQYVYALSKIRQSLRLCAVPLVSLDPAHVPRIPRSSHPGDHVRIATAIMLAYSAIEELGLEVKASREEPSAKQGNWNPRVREDLECRLRDAGVDLEDSFCWNRRGSTTLLEKAKPSQIRGLGRTPWAYRTVRDQFVEIVDAIAHVSMLRSKLAAHRMSPKYARSLSVYDAVNAQQLATRLLIESLGFKKKLREYYGFDESPATVTDNSSPTSPLDPPALNRDTTGTRVAGRRTSMPADTNLRTQAKRGVTRSQR